MPKTVVHEIKKSDKIEDAHEWQVKYYTSRGHVLCIGIVKKMEV
jgi:hypothetical protein